MLSTFFITLIFGIEEGVLAGVVLSVLMVMYRNAQPHIAVLGQLPDTNYYRNVNRFPEAIQIPDCTIIRFDSQLFFANSLYFKEFIESVVEAQPHPLKGLILDATGINDIDSSGLHALEETSLFLKKNGIIFYIAGLIGPVRDRLYKAGLMEKIGKERQFMYVQDAVDYYLNKESKDEGWIDMVTQTNYRD